MKWITENRNRIVESLFYLALTIELVLMIFEKSEISSGTESYVFRVTFALTFLAVLIMEHNTKECITVVTTLAFTLLCYHISGKNDLLRVATFIMAARDIDLKKAMKYSFYVSCAGFLLIAVLACAGVLGDIAQVSDYGRGADETRYVLGFGHPNTLLGSLFTVLLMWLWIYGKKAGVIPYLVATVASLFVSYITRSRTGLAVVVLTLVAAVIVRIWPKLSEVKAIYVIETLFSPVLCTALAVFAAWASTQHYDGPGWPEKSWFWRAEDKLNFRMSSLYYETPGRDGILSRWKLFAGRGTDGYFDLGWVRLFYWYGIIPTIVIIAVILALIYMCYKKRDIWTLVIIFSVSLYTIVEATFVTRYIGRDFFLLIAGVYLGYYFRNKGDLDAGSAKKKTV